MNITNENIIEKLIDSLMEMKPYFPKSKKSNLLIKFQKYSFITALISFLLLASTVFIWKFFDFPLGITSFLLLNFLYIIHVIAGLIFTITLIIPDIHHLFIFKFNLKKNFFNNLSCGMKHDQQNIEKLKYYSTNELKYVLDCGININLQRINLRIHNFFGKEIAVFSMIALAYSAIQNMGGLNKLQDVILNGLLMSNMIYTSITLGLSCILVISLAGIVMKSRTNHLQYLKYIIEMTIKEKEK